MMRTILVTLAMVFLWSSLCAQKRTLFIGDSITDGNWGTNCNGERNLGDMNHIFGHGYMFICASRYMAEYADAGLEFFNRGISGNTVDDLASRWQSDALELRPDVISVLVGINDVICSEGAKVDTLHFAQTLRRLLEESRTQNPEVQIVLGEPFCEEGFRVDKEGEVRRSCEALARQVKQIAGEMGAVLLPYQSMFDELCAQGETTYWIWDGVHPTPAGHHKMAQMWMERVRLMNEN